MGQGFDTFLGWKGITPNYVGDDTKTPLYRGWSKLHNSGLVTTTIEQEVIRLLQLKPSAPQFYFVAWTAPHNPWQGSFGQRIAEMDASMGRIMQHVRPNTLIIFAGDNGRGYDNAPFRGKKYDILEGGIRVPFALRWDGHVAARQRIDTPAGLIDIARTAVEAAGGSFADSDGHSLLDLLGPTRALLFKAFLDDTTPASPCARAAGNSIRLSGQAGADVSVTKDKGELIPVQGFPLIRAQLRGLIAGFRAKSTQ